MMQDRLNSLKQSPLASPSSPRVSCTGNLSSVCSICSGMLLKDMPFGATKSRCAMHLWESNGHFNRLYKEGSI